MSDHFQEKENIVVDTKTGLEWQKDSAGLMTWQEAMDYAASLGNGWRVPTIEELLSLIDFKRTNPASSFPDMPSKAFWSSSSFAADLSYAWYVSFGYGHVNDFDKLSKLHLRCVRATEKSE